MAEFRRLAEDVYAFLRPPLIWYSSARVIIGYRDVIVVDSLANADMIENLLAEIRRVTEKPVRFLINTIHMRTTFTPTTFSRGPSHLFPPGASGNGCQPEGTGQA